MDLIYWVHAILSGYIIIGVVTLISKGFENYEEFVGRVMLSSGGVLLGYVIISIVLAWEGM